MATKKKTKKETPINPPVQYNEQYFVKRGKTYHPVNDPGAYSGLGEGSWLVVVNQNCTSIRTAVDPKFIELDAALRHLESGLCDALSEASKVRSRSVLLSEKERRAWKEFKRIMGKDMPKYFEYPSHQEIAEKGCQYIRETMLKYGCDPKKIEENETKPKKVKCNNPIFDLET